MLSAMTTTTLAPTESSLRTLDLIGFLLGAIITLGPLAATAMFAH